mmetsp:Transcript_8386/g.24050  ORF Transcript_8386/g.24050 Transcript_8386/m.24050 type:complete len:599 (-) Transcript_8386:105-1901(-)
MVWDTRDVALADLAALPRAGMAKPPFLENWGDITNHSSHAAILPRSSSQYASFWRADRERTRPKAEKLAHVVATDPELCERLGFTPRSTVLTPSGRQAVVVGAIQTDPQNQDSWRLWAEYKGKVHREAAASARRSARQQMTAPGTPSSRNSTPGPPTTTASPRGAGGGGGQVPVLHGTSSSSSKSRALSRHRPSTAHSKTTGFRERSFSTSEPRGAKAIPRAGKGRGSHPTASSINVAPENTTYSSDELSDAGKGLLEAEPDRSEQGEAPQSQEDASRGRALSSHGFLLPARPVRVRHHSGREVFSPRVTYESDTSCYVEMVRPPSRDVFNLEADFSQFAGMEDLRQGRMWRSPTGTVVKAVGGYVLNKAEDGYDHLSSASNTFSWLHHRQVTAANSTDSDRTRVVLRALAPEERGRRRLNRGLHPMERSLRDEAWPRQPSSGVPFAYTEASDGENLHWSLLRDQRRNGNPFMRRFAAEPPLWAPETCEVTRPEAYLQQMGRLPYRGARMSSSPAAIATRCGHGPRAPLVPDAPPGDQSMAARILAQRRPKYSLVVDGRTGLPKTQGMQQALLDPAAIGHCARYDAPQCSSIQLTIHP